MDPGARSRIVEHAAEQGVWRMALRRPGARLAASVVNAHAEHGTAFSRRRAMPSGLATVVFNLGADLAVSFPGEAATLYRSGGALFSGASSRYAVMETDGSQTGAQIMLTPLGARRLAGCPLEEIGETLRRPKQGDATGLAALALECGYADQAHMTGDFSRFAGAPPAAFLARRLPDEGGFRD